ncbi:MAG: gamma-glutamyl kinase [Pseudomonadota bacterium]
MLIFFKERLAFLATPKTGTSAIEKALHRRASIVVRDPPGLKHTNARGFKRKFKPIVERANLPPVETVAIIREPVSWLGSWYRYRQRPALSGHKNSTEGIPFDAFVEAYLSDTPPDFAKLGAQSRFLCDDNEQCLVDHLYRYEDMSRFIDFMEARLNQNITLEQVNASPNGSTALSHALQTELKRRFSRDFALHSDLR